MDPRTVWRLAKQTPPIVGDLTRATPEDAAERHARLVRIYEGYRPAFREVRDVQPASVIGDPTVVLVDVRSAGERAVSVLPGAVSAADWLADPARFSGRRPVAYCTMGIRSGAWAADRAREGLAVGNLVGGVLGWAHAGGALVDADGQPTRRIDVGAKAWDLTPPGYEAVTKGVPGGAVGRALPGALLVAVAATAADGVWALDLLPHQLSSGVLHGLGVFLTLGLWLGSRAGRPLAGAAGGALSGAIAAASFYALVGVGGYGVMFLSWVVLWVMFAVVDAGLWRRPWGWGTIGRGIVASGAAVVGFSLVFFFLYGGWSPEQFSPVRHLVAWTLAFLPGLLVLLTERPSH